jgi:beta-hydroxylase
MFFNPDSIEYLSELRRGWPAARAEFDAVDESRFKTWPERHIFDNDWKTLILFDGYKGRRPRPVEASCAAFPETARLVEPLTGLLTAGFSRLGSGTRIHPHRGCGRNVLRVHLGVRVPDGCGISVRGQVRRWEEGGILAFDDTYLHEAWNYGTSFRTILLVDLMLGGCPEEVFADAIQPLRAADYARWVGMWIRFSQKRWCG